MPLYDFACAECGLETTLLAKLDERPPCPACGADALAKRFAPFAIGGRSGASVAPAVAAPSSEKKPAHVHSASCGCGSRPGSAKGPCKSDVADALVKKYLG